jgi:hypothetical protein
VLAGGDDDGPNSWLMAVIVAVVPLWPPSRRSLRRQTISWDRGEDPTIIAPGRAGLVGNRPELSDPWPLVLAPCSGRRGLNLKRQSACQCAMDRPKGSDPACVARKSRA